MTRVSIAHNSDIQVAIRQALDPIKQDIYPLVEDKLVAVKPNDTYASDQDQTGVTQPDTLRAVLRHLKQFNPRELVVSGGSGAAETDDVFRVVGLMDVVEEEGATFFDHNRPPFEAVDLTYEPEQGLEGPQKSVMVNPRVLEYETLIALNQLKLHETATVTLALKNIAMSYPAADYYGHPRGNEKHEHDFFADMHSFIVAMVRRFPIDLAITVGHPAMVGTGPLGGHAVETGLVIASRDAVAADVAGARLLGFNSQGVRHLWEARCAGLGEADTEKMEFPALSLDEAFVVFSKAVYGEKLNL